MSNNYDNDDILRKTLNEINHFSQQLEKEQEDYLNLKEKTELSINSLKCSLDLVNPSPQEKLEYLSKEINNYVKTSQIEMSLIDNTLQNLSNSQNNDKIRKKQFKEKEDLIRNSELSILFEREHNLRTIYFISINLLFWLMIWVMILNYQKTGNAIDFEFWNNNLRGLKHVFKLHFIICLYCNIIIIYIQIINYLAKKYNKIWYIHTFVIYLIIMIIIQIFVFYYYPHPTNNFIPGAVIGAETTRIILKLHSYFREKILYGLKEFHMEYVNFSPSSRTSSVEIVNITIGDYYTELKRFIYFFFCPSLIYRDEYNRLPKFRPLSLFTYILNFLFSITFFYVFFLYICNPKINLKYIKNYYHLSFYLLDALHMSLPSAVLLIVGFYMILHTWMNIWSEIIRHGDRRFYEDWWNSTNFEQYYRKWNMVVHEWLYYYLYNDIRRLSLGKISTTYSKIFVFLISISIHEIIITVSFGFFFPVLSFFFGGPGIIFTYIKTTSKKYNIIFWLEMLIGPGLIVSLYIWEFNLRNAFKIIPFEKEWHKHIPKIILMFKKKYKVQLIALSNKYI